MSTLREFAFSIEYDAGVDPLADVFRDCRAAAASALYAIVGRDRFWRVEWVTGPESARERVREVRFDESIDADSVTVHDCLGVADDAVLERSAERTVLYGYRGELHGGESVATLAGRYLPLGTFARVSRRDGTAEWRVFARDDRKIGLLYDALPTKLRDGMTFRMGYLRDADGWRRDPLSTVALAPEQRAALDAAVEAGYYETPRGTTLDDLADDLDVPRSTLSYRLRRAEAQLARAYAESE